MYYYIPNYCCRQFLANKKSVAKWVLYERPCGVVYVVQDVTGSTPLVLPTIFISRRTIYLVLHEYAYLFCLLVFLIVQKPLKMDRVKKGIPTINHWRLNKHRFRLCFWYILNSRCITSLRSLGGYAPQTPLVVISHTCTV